MAHFALLDVDNIVRSVIVIANADCGGGTFPASEPIGQAYINGPHPDCLALDGVWLQTSYSGSFRGCFAGLGYTYDPVINAYSPPTIGGAEGVDPGASLDTGPPLTAQGFDESGYTHDT
jgi:hypothetical protein